MDIIIYIFSIGLPNTNCFLCYIMDLKGYNYSLCFSVTETHISRLYILYSQKK